MRSAKNLSESATHEQPTDSTKRKKDIHEGGERQCMGFKCSRDVFQPPTETLILSRKPVAFDEALVALDSQKEASPAGGCLHAFPGIKCRTNTGSMALRCVFPGWVNHNLSGAAPLQMSLPNLRL